MLGEKNYWKGMQRGGKYIFSPYLEKSKRIFPNLLKIYKIDTNSYLGENINQEGRKKGEGEYQMTCIYICIWWV